MCAYKRLLPTVVLKILKIRLPRVLERHDHHKRFDVPIYRKDAKLVIARIEPNQLAALARAFQGPILLHNTQKRVGQHFVFDRCGD